MNLLYVHVLWWVFCHHGVIFLNEF